MCKYAELFGKPGEGFHAPRLLGVAAYDLLGTVVVASAVAWFGKFPLLQANALALALGIFFHALFCVDTALNRALMGNYNRGAS